MNREGFVSDFREFVGTSADVTPQTAVADIPEWDSLAAMSVVTLLASRHGANLTLAEVQQAKTVGDIMDKAEALS